VGIEDKEAKGKTGSQIRGNARRAVGNRQVIGGGRELGSRKAQFATHDGPKSAASIDEGEGHE
jgi:hypothetical protein